MFLLELNTAPRAAWSNDGLVLDFLEEVEILSHQAPVPHGKKESLQ